MQPVRKERRTVRCCVTVMPMTGPHAGSHVVRPGLATCAVSGQRHSQATRQWPGATVSDGSVHQRLRRETPGLALHGAEGEFALGAAGNKCGRRAKPFPFLPDSPVNLAVFMQAPEGPLSSSTSLFFAERINFLCVGLCNELRTNGRH